MLGILTDITKCVGCEKCVKACQRVNKCPAERPEHKSQPGQLFDTRWTTVVQRPGGRFVRRHCRHCLQPACVSVCPVGAMRKSSQGPVIYDQGRCLGCRYCMMACPYGIPRYEWSSLAPRIRKCFFCFERVSAGGQPGCTEACPEGATIFGTREALLTEAKLRLQKDPQRYIQKVYGESEVGGTAVLYISDIPLEFLGMAREMGDKPLPTLTFDVLRGTALGAGSLGGCAAALAWIIDRRNKRRKEGAGN